MKIKAQKLAGFRDFLPNDMKAREEVLTVFKRVFSSYGYEPLETPTLEHAEVLLGKYGDEADKLIYQFKDPGGRAVAMKYDLTVPACRVLAEYANKIPLPFKRYQIQPVWRADKPQRGRFREFFQCDADSLGTASMLADGEFIQMCTDLFQALGFTNFVTRINNRKLINGFVKYAGGKDEQFFDIVTSIDKLEKVGLEGVKNELAKRSIPKEVSQKILEVIKLQGDSNELLKAYQKKLSSIEEATEGLKELREIFVYLKAVGVSEKYFQFNPSIVRGLAYYTGPVWETVIFEGKVGSVTGCGRYDKLIGMFLDRDIPATGGSFGFERIVEVMKDRQMVKASEPAARILVTIFSLELLENSLDLAQLLRRSQVNCELYLDPGASLDRQLKYADKKGIPYAAIIGPDEVKNKTVTLKNMKTGEQEKISPADLLKKLARV
jgi:histidyl-tRNA synthetase